MAREIVKVIYTRASTTFAAAAAGGNEQDILQNVNTANFCPSSSDEP